MNGIFPGGYGAFDPSKMSPQVISEVSELMRSLSPDQMMKMQSLMQRAMSGQNVNAELADFERALPEGFREKMARILYMAHGVSVPAGGATPAEAPASNVLTSVDEARLVILRAVARAEMTPEEALRVLFNDKTRS